MASKFFDGHNYFIDEKVHFFKFENQYKVFNDRGEIIGSINQALTTGQKFLRVFVKKAMLPFHLEIKNSDGMLIASISRGWTFWMSRIIIKSGDGIEIGSIRQKLRFFKPTFNIFNHQETQIGQITGDWKAWNFVINNESGAQIGTITKKWAGTMKEIFTSADKYLVNIDQSYSNMINKVIIISAAITIDMVMKESQD